MRERSSPFVVACLLAGAASPLGCVGTMNDTDLRAFFSANQISPGEGGPLDPPPMYRSPNSTEDKLTHALGMEGAFTCLEAIGEAPNVFVLDARGIIRWHSAGLTPDPRGEIANDAVHTINAAVHFALDELDPPPPESPGSGGSRALALRPFWFSSGQGPAPVRTGAPARG